MSVHRVNASWNPGVIEPHDPAAHEIYCNRILSSNESSTVFGTRFSGFSLFLACNKASTMVNVFCRVRGKRTVSLLHHRLCLSYGDARGDTLGTL